ncbi:MAG: GNAT family N-acetyltransferase [Planctomycetes bacterium]|nr:GNAT family N-acetyltransferase [Planctomycetota bacterium]
MTGPVLIEPAARGATDRALQFLAAGRRDDMTAALRAEAYRAMIDGSGGRWHLWWAHRAGEPLAAALVIVYHGKVGFVFFNDPSDSPGVDESLAPAVIRSAADEALAGGLAVVQALIDPPCDACGRMLARAGFEHLAELVYMSLDVTRWRAGPPCGELAWLHYGQYDERLLAEVLCGTYEDSLDCRGLYGVREIADVIESLKHSGAFSPLSWWLLEVSGSPAGCVLVNGPSGPARTADLVYMGLLKRYRRRGLARRLVARAAEWAHRCGRKELTVAVDSINEPAKKVYEKEGFRETHRRIAYIRPAARRCERPGC